MQTTLKIRKIAVMILLTVGLATASGLSMRPAPVLADAPANGCGNGGQGDRRTFELKGAIIAAPADGFIGDWTIAPSPDELRKVIVDCATVIKDFDHGVPEAGTWVTVRGVVQNDGTVRATRLRPNDRESFQVVISLKPDVDIRNFSEEHQLKVELQMPLSTNTYLFSTREEDESIKLSELSPDHNSDVLWAEYNFVSQIPTGNPYRTWHWGGLDSTGYTSQNAFSEVNLAPAAAQYRGDNIKIAVLDTGVDRTHQALGQSLLILPGSDMVTNDDNPDDLGPGTGWGHGTHVAGIIHRIAPNSQLMPVRILDRNGRGNSFVLAYAIEWAAIHGADVINLSLGADCGSQLLQSSINAASATTGTHKGVVIVAAAGNDGLEKKQCPASMDNVIGVTAIDDTGVKADFANYGTWVDLAAPGVGITSTVPVATGFQFAAWSGTSMAAPFVSGAAALARQGQPAATAAAVAAILTGSGQDITKRNDATYTGKLGHLLDIGTAVVGSSPITGGPDRLYIPLVFKP